MASEGYYAAPADPIPTVKPDRCRGCVGWGWGQIGYMPKAEGPTTAWNKVLLVGEALGEMEALHSRPFAGRAGLALDQMLQRGGLRREHFMIDNALRCRPPLNKLVGQPYEQTALEFCAHHLDGTISGHRPLAIVPMGDIALRRLLGLPSFAKGDTLTKRRGYAEWSDRYQTWIIPTFHPSFLMRGNRHLTQVFLADLQKAVRIAHEGYRPYTAGLISDPGLDTVERYVGEFEEAIARGEDISLAYDIETPYKEDIDDEATLEVDDPTYIILRIGFCWSEREALSLAWVPQYLPYIRRLLTASCRKLTWNGRYDTPRILAAGMDIGGCEWDLMWAWHLRRSDLPKGLGFVASLLLHDTLRWKHLSGSDAGRYNALDALNTWRLERPIIDSLRTSDLWQAFQRHVVELDQVLLGMSRRGVRVDHDFRQRLAIDIDHALRGKLKEIITVVPRKARRAKVFSGTPKDLTGLLVEDHLTTVSVCPGCGLVKPKKPHFKVFKKKENPCGGLEAEPRTMNIPRYVRLEPWAPSNVQMQAYQRVLGHEPVLSKKERRPTFNEEALKVLIKQYPEDPLYPRVIDYRELETLASRYVGYPKLDENGIVIIGVEGGVPVGADGRVHTTFLHTPSTLRLASQAPNMQNIPRSTSDSELARRVKGMFIADDDHVLFELDYKAIEALLVGYAARSFKYMRLARLGVHDFLNAHILIRRGMIAKTNTPDMGWSDADLKALFKDLKKRFPAERDTAKRVVHGGNYGMTPRRMFEVYPKEFPTLRLAAELQAIYFDACPEIREWQNRIIQTADNGACLRNPYGYLHYFFHVKEWFKHNGKWEWRWGEDAKRVLAFWPQSTAAVIIKEAMLACRAEGYERYLLLQVHDSLLGMARKEEADQVWRAIAAIMARPVKCLPLSVVGQTGDLSVDIEAKVGVRWSEMEEAA